MSELLWIFRGIVLQCFFGNSAKPDTRNWKKQRRRLSSSPYPEELVNDFEQLAKNLGPSDVYIRDVERIADEVSKLLRKHGGVNLVRSKIAGSIGKGTGISYTLKNGQKSNPDLDLILFLDDAEPPFTEYLNSFAKILAELDEVSDVIVRKYSVQFRFWTPSSGDIKVDLLAAENYVSNSYPWREEDVGEVEALVALRELSVKHKQSIFNTQSVSQEENKMISSSLAEKTVKLIRELVNDDFVLKVVRLAKYWNSHVELTGYIPARSYVIEMIAIFAIVGQPKKVGGHEKRCVISGFRRFLEAVSKFSSLDISLDRNAQRIPLKNYSKPRITDSVNSWDNLAEKIPAEAIEIWEEQARRTLLLLAQWRNSKANGIEMLFENAIDEFFCHKTDNKFNLDSF